MNSTTTCSYFNPDLVVGAFASSSCETQYATGSLAAVEQGFTHGEIVSSVLLFLILAFSIVNAATGLFKKPR